MKILIIRYSSLGDVILSTVLSRNIKTNKYDAEIDFLTKEKYSSIFFNSPDINKTLSKIPRKAKYDYIIDIHDNMRSYFARNSISGEKKITIDKASYARRIYLHTRKFSKELKKTVIDRYLFPLSEMNFSIVYKEPVIYLNDTEIEKITKFLPKRKYITIAPGAKWRTKEWISEHYTDLVIKIIRELERDIVIIGDVSGRRLSEEIIKETGLIKKHIVNLTGKTNLREAAAVIKKSDVLVSTDSAPLHIGWAVGVKVVALFGPTVKEFGFQPISPFVSILEKNMECRPCSLHGSKKCRYGDRACMQRIEVYEVFNEIKKFL